MFHDDGDAIGFRVEFGDEAIVGALRERARSTSFAIVKQSGGVLYRMVSW
jgi:hypothetical protein